MTVPVGFLPRFFWSAAAITSLSAAYENAAPAETIAAYPFRWDLDAVRSALQTTGLAAKDFGPVTQPFMSDEALRRRIRHALTVQPHVGPD